MLLMLFNTNIMQAFFSIIDYLIPYSLRKSAGQPDRAAWARAPCTLRIISFTLSLADGWILLAEGNLKKITVNTDGEISALHLSSPTVRTGLLAAWGRRGVLLSMQKPELGTGAQAAAHFGAPRSLGPRCTHGTSGYTLRCTWAEAAQL